MVRLTLGHCRSEMRRLGDWLDLQEHRMAMPANIASRVRQCLEEAVVNLIDHTPAMDGDCIWVELHWHGDTLVAAVEDHGPPFDPDAVPPPARPVSLEATVPGGWGIHLIRSFADDIGYETAGGRNRLTLKFQAKRGVRSASSNANRHFP